MSRQNSSPRFTWTPLWGALAGALYFLFVRPQLLKWGTRLGESQRRLPGDELIPAPNMQWTRAIDIDAPPEAVWPWLAQMGRERTGWYRLDVLDNGGIPSATYIRQDLPPPQVGMALDGGWQVLGVEPGHMLLIGSYDRPNLLGTSTDMVMAYRLERKSDGSTRLLVRLRAFSYGIAGVLYNLLFEPLDFVASRQQLQGIKARAETMAHLKLGVPRQHEISLN